MNGLDFAILIALGLAAVVAWHFNREQSPAEDLEQPRSEEWNFNLDPRYARERRRRPASWINGRRYLTYVPTDDDPRPTDDPRYQLGAH